MSQNLTKVLKVKWEPGEFKQYRPSFVTNPLEQWPVEYKFGTGKWNGEQLPKVCLFCFARDYWVLWKLCSVSTIMQGCGVAFFSE